MQRRSILAGFIVGLASIALLTSPVAGQTSGPDQVPPADPSSSQSAPPQAPTQPPAVGRPVSWKLVLPNLVSDQHRIWTFPSRLERKRNWVPTASILAAAAGLVALDPTEANYFRRSTAFHGFNSAFTSNRMMYGTLLAPAAIYVAGVSRRDSKMTGTALFAGEALADTGLLGLVLKDVTRRVRPVNLPPHGNAYDTWFESGGSIINGRGSFPSGHTIAAFSVATVVARRYRNHRWVPWVAYGGAAMVGLSRLSLSAHFASDVFMGAALGYSISRFAVLQE
jgi:membrane-associated phospholipid phosphatase